LDGFVIWFKKNNSGIEEEKLSLSHGMPFWTMFFNNF